MVNVCYILEVWESESFQVSQVTFKVTQGPGFYPNTIGEEVEGSGGICWRSEGCARSGIQGQSTWLGGLGRSPQKLKAFSCIRSCYFCIYLAALWKYSIWTWVRSQKANIQISEIGEGEFLRFRRSLPKKVTWIKPCDRHFVGQYVVLCAVKWWRLVALLE